MPFDTTLAGTYTPSSQKTHSTAYAHPLVSINSAHTICLYSITCPQSDWSCFLKCSVMIHYAKWHLWMTCRSICFKSWCSLIRRTWCMMSWLLWVGWFWVWSNIILVIFRLICAFMLKDDFFAGFGSGWDGLRLWTCWGTPFCIVIWQGHGICPRYGAGRFIMRRIRSSLFVRPRFFVLIFVSSS